MLFNSYEFLFLFLPVTLYGFFWLGRRSVAYGAAWLALASLLFYGFWNPAYVGLLLASIGFNYVFGLWISRANARRQAGRKRHLLIFSITANLALLAYYKYANFFLTNIDTLTGSHWTLPDIILPLGISFFTFTQIAFLVDTYQGKVKEYDFVHYVLFVTFFPHLIAGPVLHHKEMMPQFAHLSTYRPDWNNIATGWLLLTLGLCKKTMLADPLAPYVNLVFDGAQTALTTGAAVHTYEAWAGALAYTLQIYFDFSGYTDMALGTALMFNIRLPTNFNSPYKATSIIEFWRRWHITLSTFLRDYLYIPLGGNRHGQARRHANLLITMLLGGLWHGAGWTFVLWGAMHGSFLVINHLWQGVCNRLQIQTDFGRIGKLAGAALTFMAVVSAWVVFRADNLPQALTLLQAMCGMSPPANTFPANRLIEFSSKTGRDLLQLIALGLLWVWILPNSSRIVFRDRGPVLTVVQGFGVIALLCVVIDRFGNYSPFLYFQF